jgi:hypothetical protein
MREVWSPGRMSIRWIHVWLGEERRCLWQSPETDWEFVFVKGVCWAVLEIGLMRYVFSYEEWSYRFEELTLQ